MSIDKLISEPNTAEFIDLQLRIERLEESKLLHDRAISDCLYSIRKFLNIEKEQLEANNAIFKRLDMIESLLTGELGLDDEC